jgi:hypothetical protein
MKDKEFKTIRLGKETANGIFSNLCITLNANKLDYVCAFEDDCIGVIKCGEFIIGKPVVIGTDLLFILTDKNNLVLGFYDTRHLLKALRGEI